VFTEGELLIVELVRDMLELFRIWSVVVRVDAQSILAIAGEDTGYPRGNCGLL
jgi:hypothetical protein